MSATPHVSIITGFLNSERFLAEAVESVFAQTYPDWELLLVDDGSTDGGSCVARTAAERCPGRVRYLEHPGHQNRGVCASRNLGLREARGKYIALLDADDVWLPHKLEQQVEILETCPEVSMVFGRTEYWYSWMAAAENGERDYAPDYGVPAGSIVPCPHMVTHAYPLGAGAAPCPSDLLLRRELAERIGGFEESFRGKYQLYEDQAFLSKVYLNADILISGECWTRYRLHSDSCMARVVQAGQYYSVRGFFLHWLEGYLNQHAVNDPAIRRALRAALRPYHYSAIYRPWMSAQAYFRRAKDYLKRRAKQALPPGLHQRLWLLWQIKDQPPVGWVRFGSLRRLVPISQEFGYDRGQPIDRYYIENFLAYRARDIHGRVLEIGDNSYTLEFGRAQVTHSDVLHSEAGNPQATIVGDLTNADHLQSEAFDCVILTQTLHLIYDVQAALQTVYRILKPGGVLLATVPGISQIGYDRWGATWYWSFTPLSATRAISQVFPPGNSVVESHGNVLTSSAFLYGLAAKELRPSELGYNDPYYPMLITIRATKPKVTP
jgi:glycosyltransferase involved in cell wall biosynthesis